MPTPRLADLVLRLVDPQNGPDRIQFFCNPTHYIETFEQQQGQGTYSPEQKAILFTMDRIAIATWIDQHETVDVTAAIMGYNFDDQDWDTVDCGNRSVVPEAVTRVLRAMAGARGGGGGWTAPLPQISDVQPDHGELGNPKFPVTIVGEGILEDALLILTNPYESDYPPTFVSGKLEILETRNFRHITARTELDLSKVAAPRDEYELCFLNPGSVTPVTWGDAFPVK